MLYYAALCYIILYFAILRYSILCYVMLHHAILYYIVLCCAILRCIVMYCGCGLLCLLCNITLHSDHFYMSYLAVIHWAYLLHVMIDNYSSSILIFALFIS